MTGYKKTYCEFFGYNKHDTIPSEYSGEPAVDIHHLTKRGKYKDAIWNLIALTREEHYEAESNPAFNTLLKFIHVKNIIKRAYAMLKIWN